MRPLLIKIALVLSLLPSAAAQVQLFPLAKGTSWTYEGTVRWVSTGNEEHSKRIQWRMEVVDTASGPDFRAALIEGAPWELAWYDPEGTVRSKYIILVVGDATYLFDRGSPADTFQVLKTSGLTKELRDQLPENIWYREPITPDGLYCAPDQKERRDRMYCWAVSEIKSERLTGIAGVQHSVQRLVTLAFVTLPDHQYIDFVPGTGIVRYQFGHHGTLSEVDVRLVEFHRGEKNP